MADNATDASTNANDGGNDGNAAGNGAGGNGETSTQEGATRVFTQRELDLILSDRLNRERSKFADYDDLKTKAQRWEETEQARLSDIERATKAAQEAEQRASQAEQALRSERLRNALFAESTKAGAVDPDAVAALINHHALIDSKGDIVGVAEAVASLLESKPYLKGAPAGPTKASGSIGNGANRDNGTSAGTFTRSQLRDPGFFEANKDAIMAAAAAGKIIDD